MTLKIIGAGFGRTGTLSMKLALEQLGFGPCHHMMEVFGKDDHIAQWQQAAEGNNTDWQAIFDGYNSVVDWPACYFWQELAQQYPQAKILLTLRDPDKWADSVEATIFKGLRRKDVRSDPHGKMADTIITQNTFGGDIVTRQHLIDIYNAHNQKVIDTIPAERLLVFEAAQGWAPLCEFLQVDVPNSEYPRSNSTDEFLQRVSDRQR